MLRLAPRPVFLAGREELLAELDARLAGDDGAGPRVVALCGLGGAGKTSVALEYAHRQLAEVGVAWQFPAEDPAVLAAGFGELAAQLGAADARGPGGLGARGAGRQPGAVAAGVRQRARPGLGGAVRAAGRARAGADHQPEPDLAARPGRWRCRCSTRRWLRSSWSAGPATRTGRRPWTWPVSWAGCRWRWSRPPRTSRPAGTAWPGTWHCSGSGARTCWAVASRPGTAETVATTWRLAFEDLQQAAPGAAGLLRLLAFCAPEAIPLRLLLQPRPGLAGRLGEEVAPVLAPLLEDPLAAGDAIAALRRYSLVTPAADGSVSVHRLVQAVTADQMPAELARQWRQAAAALIEAAIPGDTDPPGTWPVCAALLPHAQAALADDSDGMARIANYLGSSGSYAAARDLQRRVLDARERVLGPEHPDTLAARATSPAGPGRRGTRPPPGTCSPRCCPCTSGSSARSTRTP